MLPSKLPDLGNRAIAADTETSGLFADEGARISTVSIAWEGHSYAFPFEQGPRDSLFDTGDLDPNLPESEWRALLDWLSKRRLVWHNSKFDLGMFAAGTARWPGIDLQHQTVFDTMLCCRRLWPIEPVGLGPTTERLGIGKKTGNEVKLYLKKHRLPAGRYDKVPVDLILPYATLDAELTYALFLLQLELIDLGHAARSDIDHDLAVMKTLYRMEQRGIGFDRQTARTTAELLRRRRIEIETRMPFTPAAGVSSAKQWFYGPPPRGLGLTPSATTPTGLPQLDELVLRKLIAKKTSGAVEYAEWRKIDQALGMYYEGWANLCGPDGRLRTSFRQLGTVSGRFSASRAQIHAVPRNLGIEGVPGPKQLLVAKPGCVLFELDLQGAEMRVAAKLAGCERMVRLFEEGADIHGATAIELFDTNPDAPGWDRSRQTAKRANLSLAFSVGPKTFKATILQFNNIEISMAESGRIVDAWRALYPEFGRANHKWERFAERKRHVPLVGGGSRWYKTHEFTSSAWNQRVQGSLANLLQHWLIGVDKRWPGALVLTVHDSLVVELPEAEAEATAKEIAGCGEQLGEGLFDIPMPVEIGRFGQ